MTPIAAALTLFFLPVLVASSPDPRIGDCVPKSCGNVTNITYPFWLSARQPDYCGFPEFKLHCEEDDDTPSLQTPNGAYHVRNIFYSNQSMLVAPTLPVVGSANTDCQLYHNLTFTSTPFNVSSANRDLVLLYNCTKPPRLDHYGIPCPLYQSYSFLGDDYSFPEHFALAAKCYVAVLPVMGFPGVKPRDYNKLIQDGFLLDWTTADCSDCKESGGDCGFNVSGETFMCICEDRAHSWHCGIPRKKAQIHVAIIVAVSLAVIIMCFLLLLTWIRCRQRWTKLSVEKTTLPFGIDRLINIRECEKAFMSPLYPLYSITQATNNFSNENKLGEGGFGPVYKAWELWKEAKLLELVDPSFIENCPQHEISRCVHIALMCVQENAIDRPNMSTVIAMLSSDSAIADPKQPAFFNVRNPVEEELHSVNGATITSINGR